MAFCSNCGHQLADDAKFCFACGAKVNDAAVNQEMQRKTVYDGEIHKCPNCGEIMDAFVSNCPSCGYELRGTGVTSVVHEFAKEISRADTAKAKEELIRNFYVPNTREDIIEFFILANSNIETDADCWEAWAAKMEQTYQKAKLTFGSTSEFVHLEELRQKSLKLIQKKRSLGKTERAFGTVAKTVAKSLWLKCVILGAIGVVIMIIGGFNGAASGDSDSPYYMLMVLGMFPLLASFLIPMVIHERNKKKAKDSDE